MKEMDRAKKNLDVSKELLSAGKDALDIGKKLIPRPIVSGPTRSLITR